MTARRWPPWRRSPTSASGGPSLRAERIAGLAMTLPALAFFLVFVGYPITQTILIGFQRWNTISAPEWIGLANYRRMLDDPVFRHALFVTFVLTAAMTVLLTVLPMLVAVIFAQGWGRLGTLYRTILFIPAVISWVVTGGLWKLILEPNLGSLNTLLGRFGFEGLRHNWLGDEGLVLYVIVVVAVWQQIGLYVVIYYAGLQSIDPTLYEAARVDGANGLAAAALGHRADAAPGDAAGHHPQPAQRHQAVRRHLGDDRGRPGQRLAGARHLHVPRRLRQPRVARLRLRLGVEHGDPRPLPRRRFGADPPRPTLQCLTARCWSTGRTGPSSWSMTRAAGSVEASLRHRAGLAARRGRSAWGASRRAASAASAR